MDFSVTEDQQLVQDLAQQIFGDCCNHERARQLENTGAWLDEPLWRELAAANLTALCVPEALGGSGFGLIESVLVLQEAGRACAPVPLLETLLLGTLPLVQFGSDAQRKRWLAPVADSAGILTAALSEAGNTDPARPRLRATCGDAGWRLDGQKICVPAAAKASCILVPASLYGANEEQGENNGQKNNGQNKERKVGVFLVAPDSPGLEVQQQQAINWQLQGLLEFSGVEVSAEALLGGEENGASIIRWIVERARLGIAAMMLGVGEEALKRTAAYLTDRKQFGRQLGSFQATQMRCADAYVDLEGMRSTLWQAVWRVDAGLRAGAEVGAAKWWASRAGDRIVHSAQHLHAGIGSDVDYPIHRYFLWAQQLTNLLGGPTQQLAEIGAMLVSDDERPTL